MARFNKTFLLFSQDLFYSRQGGSGGLQTIPAAPALFEDRTAGSGIDFFLHNSPRAEKHQIETMAGGVALFDYGNDGYADI